MRNTIPRRSLSERDRIIARVRQQKAETTYSLNIAYSGAAALAGGPLDFDGYWTRALAFWQRQSQWEAWRSYHFNVVAAQINEGLAARGLRHFSLA